MRFRLRTLRFRTKVNLGIIAIVGPIALILGLVISHMAARALVSESKHSGSVLASNLAMRAVDPMLGMDFLRLKNLVDELRRVDKHVAYGFILDESGSILVHTFTGGFPIDLLQANAVDGSARVNIRLLDTGADRIDDFAAPILVANKRFGTVRLGVSRAKVQTVVNQLMAAITGVSAAAFALSLVASGLFASRVTRRLNLLRGHAENIVRGNMDQQAVRGMATRCWQERECGLASCPAHGDENCPCWYLAGVLDHSPDHHGASVSCEDCAVYRAKKGDEIQDLAETFDVMSLWLKTHIHELRDAEATLSRQQQLLRSILDASPDMVSMVDENLVYQAANKAFAAFVGLAPEAVAGKANADMFDPDEARRRDDESRRALAAGRRSHHEVQLRRGDDAFWYHVVLTPVSDAQGRTIGLLRSARDITELKRVQGQLVQSQKMESLGKLAGGVAHEINTPLGIILGYAQLLREDAPEDGQLHQDLGIIEKQAKVCRKIVSDLLGFSRQAESAKLEMCFNNSVMEVVTLVRHTFYLDNTVIHTDLDDRQPIIYGDPEKLKQVWMNLLHNALGAMSGGGVIVVRTRLDSPAMKLTLWVADTGAGIAQDNLNRIFDPFFSTKPVGKGTGLGLSVSFGIIEAHGGTIRAESPCPPDMLAMARAVEGVGKNVAFGPGTVFIVDLPLDHQAVEAAATTA
ncbi:MAG: PAS domain-containing protein [Desulfovibrionaceae bacterium]